MYTISWDIDKYFILLDRSKRDENTFIRKIYVGSSIEYLEIVLLKCKLKMKINFLAWWKGNSDI